MPFINLIQEQRAAKQREELRSRSLLFALLVSVGAVVGVYGFFLFESESLTSQKSKLASELQSAAPITKQIDDANAKIAEFAPKLKTLQDAQDITDRWNRILKHLATQTPVDAWLTGIRCVATDPTKPIGVTFDGLAKGQGPVGEFTLRLQNCDDLDNVVVKYTNERTVGQTQGTEFELSSELVGTAPDKLMDLSGGKS